MAATLVDVIGSAALALLLFGGLGSLGEARTLAVGPGAAYASPSAALRAAVSGDVIAVAPGVYFDCAVWQASNVTLEGIAPGVILTDSTCQGKAILVIAGNDAIVRNVTLQRARVADANGAGIRAEGTNLTIDRVRFLNNESGILGADAPGSTLSIADSDFIDDGVCRPDHPCAYALSTGLIARLRVTHCRFFATRDGMYIRSLAQSTALRDNDIEDGPTGTSRFLVDVPNGGALVMRGNRLEKGPRFQGAIAAISLGEEGVIRPTGEITITGNHFTNDGPPITFVRNLTQTTPVLSDNVFAGDAVVPLSREGAYKRWLAPLHHIHRRGAAALALVLCGLLLWRRWVRVRA